MVSDCERPLSGLAILAGLNIPNIGVNMAAALADHFGSMDALIDADAESLQKIEGVGSELTENLHAFLISEQTKLVLAELRAVGG